MMHSHRNYSQRWHGLAFIFFNHSLEDTMFPISSSELDVIMHNFFQMSSIALNFLVQNTDLCLKQAQLLQSDFPEQRIQV